MKLFNFTPMMTCVAVLLLAMLVIPVMGLPQTPDTKTENVPTAVSHDDVKLTPESKEAATVAKIAGPRQVDFDLSAQSMKPAASTIADSSPKKQDSSDDSGWHFGVAPYLFLSGLSGRVGARGRTFDLGSADFSGGKRDNFAIGFMAAVEARKGRFVILNDLVWANITSEKDTAGPFYATTKLGTKLFIIDPEAGYRFVNSEKGSIDVLGGVRVWSVEASLNATTGVLPGFDVSQRKTWAAPVIGVRGVANITPRFFLAGKFDIGGAGIGADLTTQLYGAAGYKFTKHVAMLGGYRWLQVDYDDEAGFLFDTQMSGIMLGMKFSW